MCVQVQRIVTAPTQGKLQKYVETHNRRRSKKENAHENPWPIWGRGPTNYLQNSVSRADLWSEVEVVWPLLKSLQCETPEALESVQQERNAA